MPTGQQRVIWSERPCDGSKTDKNLVWKMTRAAVADGLLPQRPCQVCNLPGALTHHPDYCFPYAVIWLCPRHHQRHHLGRSIQEMRATSPDFSKPVQMDPVGPRTFNALLDAFGRTCEDLGAELDISASSLEALMRGVRPKKHGNRDNLRVINAYVVSHLLKLEQDGWITAWPARSELAS